MIPSSVAKKGDDAFCLCVSLLGVAVPSSVVELGKAAFSECCALKKAISLQSASLLEQISIPDSVTVIGPFSFLLLFVAQNGDDSDICESNRVECV